MKIIAANWKEHPLTLRHAERLFDESARIAAQAPGIETAICPPAIYLAPLAERAKRLPARTRPAIGAQDVFFEEEGAFTGAIGPKMLSSLGVAYAIIGHSERRRWFGEDDGTVAKKVRAADVAGVRPILCIGEPRAVRAKGIAAAKRYLASQLSYALKGAFAGNALRELTVAYEPIWAIGSGKNDNPADAAMVASFIRETVGKIASGKHPGLRVLYGGSVNGGDVGDYVKSKEIDGALVGGASLRANDFKRLISAAAGQ